MKKDFTRFTKRNKHKRRERDAAKKELLRAVRESGVGYDSIKLRAALDAGRRGRTSATPHRDEIEIRGIFSSAKGGFGFVTPEAGGEDIYIPESKCRGALEGDFVRAVYHSFTDRDGRERTEGRVTEIIDYGSTAVIGTVMRERHGRRGGYYYLLPDDPRFNLQPTLRELSGAREGDKVKAKLLREGTRYPMAEVTKSFGRTETKDANYSAVLDDAGIISEFSEEELSSAENMADEPIKYDGRADLTGEIIFTIDGAGAKDLDDAVSLSRLSDGGYRLGVHIADVSHYVKEKTPLDRAVMARGTSVYFADKVVPMLPPALSNGACSLNAGEPKYTMSAVMRLTKDGELSAVELLESVIVSRVRGVYSEVNAILSGSADPCTEKKYSEVLPTLRLMAELYEKRRSIRDERGSIDFDADEAEIVLGADGFPTDIVRRERGVAERIIEELMLLANEAVARELTRAKIPCVYRIHEAPPPDKFSQFVDYVHSLGLDATVIRKENPTPGGLSALLSVAEERGILMPVSRTMLRTMAKAKYSAERSAHFGLGIDTYCHFTSPIRRLSDLATHRIIKKVLFVGRKPEYYSSYAKRAAAAATDGELRALGAERRIENLYKVLYMKERVGEEFAATVSSVTSFGFFVELDNTVEGLVPLDELYGIYTFDEKTLTLRSRDSAYKIGDRIAVRLIDADVIRGKLTFVPTEEK